MITFDCPECGKHIRIADSTAGKEGKCKGCGNKVRIPAISVAPPISQIRPPIVPKLEPALANDANGSSDHWHHPVDQFQPERAQDPVAELVTALECIEEDSRFSPSVTPAGPVLPRRSPSPSGKVQQRYRALRVFIGIFRVIGVLTLLLGGLVCAMYFVRGTIDSSSLAFSFAAAVVVGFVGVAWLAVAEAIAVLLDMEENTRASRQALEWLVHDRSQSH